MPPFTQRSKEEVLTYIPGYDIDIEIEWVKVSVR